MTTKTSKNKKTKSSHKHSHSHDHGHDHEHSHGIGGHVHGTPSHKILIFAIIVTLGYALVEALGGWWAGSLTLLGDAGHMGSDAFALCIAALAAWISLKPPSHKHSYGLGRAEVVAAWLSSLILLIISLAVIVEAVARIHEPTHVKGGIVIIIAFLGLLVNIFIAWLLARSERTINVRAAILHVMGDVLGSLAALISGTVIYFTGWMPIDPILSILIGVLIMISSLRLLRESLQILMEGVPSHISIHEVQARMSTLKDVKAIHDLHIWTLSSGTIALSAHVDIHELSSWQNILAELMKLLKETYDIDHVTLQPEPDIIDCQPCINPKKR